MMEKLRERLRERSPAPGEVVWSGSTGWRHAPSRGQLHVAPEDRAPSSAIRQVLAPGEAQRRVRLVLSQRPEGLTAPEVAAATGVRLASTENCLYEMSARGELVRDWRDSDKGNGRPLRVFKVREGRP